MDKQKYHTALISFLSECVTEERLAKFNAILDQRTRHITVVLEDIFQPHNASAVLRTCDCFGVQDVHIIENSNTYEVNPDVALGSSKWLDLVKYNRAEHNTRECMIRLKEAGYTLVATSPHNDDITLQQIDVSQPLALLFGTELKGLSDEALEMADLRMRIPMYGFTESFNISVSAALCLQELTYRMRKSDIDWGLSDIEKQRIMLDWLRASIRSSSQHENAFRDSWTD